MWEVLFDSTSDTLINILTWITISLLTFKILNLLLNDKIYKGIEYSKNTQVFVAAILGAIPGCGGPLILVPLYNDKKISFGALTAAFIATFGDAAFIILAISPIVFLHLLWISLLTGIVFGYFLDLSGISQKIQDSVDVGFKKKTEVQKPLSESELETLENKYLPDWFYILDKYIFPSILFTIIISLFPATIMNLTPFVDTEVGMAVINVYEWIAFSSIWIFLGYFILRRIVFKIFISRDDRSHYHGEGELKEMARISNEKESRVLLVHAVHDVFLDILFILFWVFLGLFTFNTLFFVAQDAIENLFSISIGWLGVVVAIIVGMIPGSAPQIILVNFWAAGAFSASALSANSVNQDGDAAYTLIASNPKASLYIRFVNLVPALMIGFGMYGLELLGIVLFTAPGI